MSKEPTTWAEALAAWRKVNRTLDEIERQLAAAKKGAPVMPEMPDFLKGIFK